MAADQAFNEFVNSSGTAGYGNDLLRAAQSGDPNAVAEYARKYGTEIYNSSNTQGTSYYFDSSGNLTYALSNYDGSTTYEQSQFNNATNKEDIYNHLNSAEGLYLLSLNAIANANNDNNASQEVPGPQQPQPTISDNGSFWSHLVGPILIVLGQPINALKPIGMLGSRAGSSVASYTLRKIIPGTLKGTFGETIGGELVGLAGTNGLGAALGRFVPVLGIALTLGDIQSWGFHQTLNNAPNDRVREEMLTGYSLGL